MTENGKSKLGWVTILGGIPLAVLATWVFTAGTLRGNFENVKEAAYKSVEINQAQDIRLLRLEVNYDHVRNSMDEIKADLKEIKQLVLKQGQKP